MIAKLHLRRMPNGGYYVQGFIPENDINTPNLPEFSDCIAGAEIVLMEIRDRETQYSGKSNRMIAAEGFL
ncbi:MAG: hypothetical protein ACXV8W_14965 [Methylobacter sp.]